MTIAAVITDWASIIRADLARSVEGYLAAGQHLAEAKAELSHGEWLPLVADIGISASMAQKLIAITKNKVLANAEHVQHLPQCWGTLYQLSRMEPDALELAIEDGTVTPALQRKDAAALVRDQNIPEAAAEPEPTGKYKTFIADPPWQYSNTSTRGAAEDHYPTMTIEELCALNVVRDSAEDQAHLYLWTTAGHLPQAFSVMEAWGFEYKTYLVWCKPQIGMGNYFRISTELVLFGVKGGMRTQARDIRNWFEAKRAKHSAKPLEFHMLVEKASPGPYMELFSRCHADMVLTGCTCSKCRLGWAVWGNQAQAGQP